ncbi:MAG: 3-oxoacyl-ACP synthase [Spirochaetes bacterium]|nr:3-oxoacyl-ACP synthase [Spirochaetota bacterium]
MYKSKFESIGAYTPEKIVTNEELLTGKDASILLALDTAGIKKRRWRAQSEDSVKIAITAAGNCLKNSSYKASDLEVVIYSSITRFHGGLKHHLEPAISLLAKNRLGAHSAINLDITNACAGMLTGAYILDNMIRSGSVRNGMVISGECITPISETALKEIKDRHDDQLASLTVGDAGAAFILDRSDDENECIEFINFTTIAAFAKHCIGVPSNRNPGPAMYTKTKELYIESFKRLPVFLKTVLEKNNKSQMDDYDFNIYHQTSPKVIELFRQHLKYYFNWEPRGVIVNVDEYGNTASTSHFVALHNAIKEKKIPRGSRVLFYSAASGLVLGLLSAKIGSLGVRDGAN